MEGQFNNQVQEFILCGKVSVGLVVWYRIKIGGKILN